MFPRKFRGGTENIVRFPELKKQVQKYIGFNTYYRNYIPRLSEKLLGFYELLEADRQTDQNNRRIVGQPQSDQRCASTSMR